MMTAVVDVSAPKLQEIVPLQGFVYEDTKIVIFGELPVLPLKVTFDGHEEKVEKQTQEYVKGMVFITTSSSFHSLKFERDGYNNIPVRARSETPKQVQVKIWASSQLESNGIGFEWIRKANRVKAPETVIREENAYPEQISRIWASEEELLNWSWDPNMIDSVLNASALAWAVRAKRVKTVEALLKANAKVNLGGMENRSKLLIKCRFVWIHSIAHQCALRI